MRFSLFNCSIGILLFAVATGIQAGNIYKWTDAQGNVHYSQHKPKNHKTMKTIDVRGRTINSKAPTSTPLRESINETAETNAKKPTKEQEKLKELESQVKKQNDEMKKQRCQALKESMENLAVGGRIYENVNGKRKYLTGPEIEAKHKSTTADYQKDCS